VLADATSTMRRRELSIRGALGASRASLRSLVLTETLKLVGGVRPKMGNGWSSPDFARLGVAIDGGKRRVSPEQEAVLTHHRPDNRRFQTGYPVQRIRGFSAKRSSALAALRERVAAQRGKTVCRRRGPRRAREISKPARGLPDFQGFERHGHDSYHRFIAIEHGYSPAFLHRSKMPPARKSLP
jgi:hypothetical protein